MSESKRSIDGPLRRLKPAQGTDGYPAYVQLCHQIPDAVQADMACARPGRRPTKHLITSWLLTIIGSTTPWLAARHHHLRARRACVAAISSASVRRGRVTAICCYGSPTRTMIFARKLLREIDLADQIFDSLGRANLKRPPAIRTPAKNVDFLRQ